MRDGQWCLQDLAGSSTGNLLQEIVITTCPQFISEEIALPSKRLA